ncbi:MAG TPA: carbohydrate ABC transporter permease [Anaerolineales bacterium]|nr:carbohydrate ABC transporter permease [Anaerolineales bacterium]
MSSRIASQETTANAVAAATRLMSALSLVVLAVTFLLPLYWMFTGSFKLQQVTMAVPPEFIPTSPTLENWALLFTGPWPIWNWVLNSVIVSTLTVVLVLIVSALTGYGFGKLKFPGSNVLFVILLSTMFLPSQVILVPLFLLVRNLHLTDTVLGTYFAMAMPLIASPFGIFLVKQFCSGIPDELLDAARIDGASDWGTFVWIMLPLLKPALASLAIFTFNQSWNFFMWHMVIATDTLQYTVPLGVSIISRTPSFGKMIVDVGMTMAGGSFGAFFMIVFFIAFQQYFVRGITLGAVKG